MKVHHLNCGSLCPAGGRLVDGFSPGLFSHLSCHCLLIETPNSGLVLVDTGLSHRELRKINPTLARFHQIFDRPQVRFSAAELVKKMGFHTRDVRHIIATHLDFDHVGGIPDFPEALVHVTALEMQEAVNAKGFIQKRRYALDEFKKHLHWKFYDHVEENWRGFNIIPNLEGLPPELFLIPLRGHTLGQVGVAVESTQGYLLHAADSYLYRGEIHDKEKRKSPIGMKLYERIFDVDFTARVENQYRLREYMQQYGEDTVMFCSHDFKEFENLKSYNAGKNSPFIEGLQQFSA